VHFQHKRCPSKESLRSKGRHFIKSELKPKKLRAAVNVSLQKAYQMSTANLCPALISNKQCNSFKDLCFICSYLNDTLPNQTAAVQQRAKEMPVISAWRIVL